VEEDREPCMHEHYFKIFIHFNSKVRQDVVCTYALVLLLQYTLFFSKVCIIELLNLWSYSLVDDIKKREWCFGSQVHMLHLFECNI
jgi:hypothetical protein